MRTALYISHLHFLAGLKVRVDEATLPRHCPEVFTKSATDGIGRVVIEIVVTDSASAVQQKSLLIVRDYVSIFVNDDKS